MGKNKKLVSKRNRNFSILEKKLLIKLCNSPLWLSLRIFIVITPAEIPIIKITVTKKYINKLFLKCFIKPDFKLNNNILLSYKLYKILCLKRGYYYFIHF